MSDVNVGRNDPCRCGSGKKYKKCCMSRDDEARRLAMKAHEHDHVCNDPSHHHGDHAHEHDEFCDHDHDHSDDDGYDAGEPDEDRDPDPVWEAMEDQPLDRQVELVVERVKAPAPLHPDDWLELLEVLGIELLRERRPADLDRLLDAAREHQPALAEELGTFDRTLRAWASLQRESDEAPLLDAAAHATEDADELIRLLDGFRYHGRLALVERALATALEQAVADDPDSPLVLELREIAAQVAIAAALDANPELDACGPELAARLAQFGDVDTEFLAELIRRRTGRGIEPLTVDDLLAVTNVDEAEQATFLLSLEFCGELVRSHGWTRARAEMARAEITAYLTERMLELAGARSRGAKHALRGVPKRAGYLIPDKSSMERYLEVSADPVTGSLHAATALIMAFPAWLGLLAKRSVIAADEVETLQAELREVASLELPAHGLFCEDPTLLADLDAALAR